MRAAQIVLIEDNPSDVLLVRMALQEKGIPFSLRQYECGADAVKELCATQNDCETPDAILLDLNTPRTDGFEALLQLKQSPGLAQVPSAIITSSRARSDRYRATLLGARYIEKPTLLRDFLSSVGSAVNDMLSVSARARETDRH